MNTVNLLGAHSAKNVGAIGALNSAVGSVMNIPQWIIIGVAALGIVIIMLVLFRLMYILIYKPELRAELRNAAKIFREQKRRIIAEKERAEAEILKSEREIIEKERRTSVLNSEAERLMLELVQQGLQEEEAIRISEMTLDQLLVLKEKEQKDLSGNYIINAITRKVLIDSDFEKRTDVEDFKVPLNKTVKYTVEDVESFINTLLDVTYEQKLRPPMDVYIALGKSFVMVTKRNDEFFIKVKCGTYYGQRLMQLYPGNFSKASFPAGMLWFDISNGEGCSLELVKLLVTISYNIAKAGY